MKILQRFPRETGREYALRTLRENIISLTLEPGSQVSENELAAAMGISRTPVREALIELAKINIVQVAPQKRSTIALVDYKLVEEARFLREILECAVVQLVCETADEQQLLALQKNVHMQKFCLENQHFGELFSLDEEFHAKLFQIANKNQLYTMMKSISIHFDRVRSMSLFTVKNLKMVQDHEQILQAISQKNSQQAMEYMKQHLARYKIDEHQLRERYPAYFA